MFFPCLHDIFIILTVVLLLYVAYHVGIVFLILWFGFETLYGIGITGRRV